MRLHMPRRDLARWIAVIAVPVALLAGCSDDGTATSESTASTTTGSTTEPPAEVDQTAPGSANGIKVAADGTLWIASIDADAILQVDADTGRILRRVTAPDGSGPDDVAIGEDGTVYWTGFLNGDVGLVASDRDDAELVANIGEGANPIAVRDDGKLLVGRAIVTSGLFVVDPSGGTEPVELPDPGGLNSFDVAPDGVLYAPLLDPGSVIALDPTTGEVLRTVTPVDGAPIALRWHDGQLYVLTIADGAQVLRIDSDTGASELFANTGLDVADNLAVDADGRVLVTGLNDPTVTVVGTDGTVERTIRIGA